jgi:hypothetical protein
MLRGHVSLSFGLVLRFVVLQFAGGFGALEEPGTLARKFVRRGRRED